MSLKCVRQTNIAARFDEHFSRSLPHPFNMWERLPARSSQMPWAGEYCFRAENTIQHEI